MTLNSSALLSALRAFPTLPDVFNPWADHDSHWDVPGAADTRAQQLASYLDARIGRARLVLCAEAAGCYGCKFSGIAMTDERVLSGNKTSAPFKEGDISPLPWRRTSNVSNGAPKNGVNEMTSTILYEFLYTHGISPYDVVTWNAFPFHPHKSGNTFSNRTPRTEEIEAAHHLHDVFFNLFSDCQVIAVGNHAKNMLSELGFEVPAVRHPANGGAGLFGTQLGGVLGV